MAEGVPVIRVRVLAAVSEVEAAVGHVVGVVAVAVALVLRVSAAPVFRRIVQAFTFLRGENSNIEGTSCTDFPAYSDTLGTREKCHCKQVKYNFNHIILDI